MHDVAVPYRSEAQRRFMHERHPEIAKRFDAETPAGAKLPEHVHRGRVVTALRRRYAGGQRRSQ